MTFRAVVQDGLIVVNTHGALADGTTVEIMISDEKRATKKIRKGVRSKKPGKHARSAHTPGYGMWVDRADLGTPEQAVDRLRSLTRRRRVG